MSGSDPARSTSTDGLNSHTSYQSQLQKLEQEKDELQLMLDVAIEHSDALLDSLRQKNQELTLQLEHATDLVNLRPVQQTVEQFQLVTEALPIGLIIAHITNGQIIYGNPAACRLLGASAEQLSEQKITDFCHDAADCQQVISAMQNQQAFSGELCWIQANGHPFNAVTSLQLFVFKNELALLTVIQSSHPLSR